MIVGVGWAFLVPTSLLGGGGLPVMGGQEPWPAGLGTGQEAMATVRVGSCLAGVGTSGSPCSQAGLGQWDLWGSGGK